ncbi:MAG TPA: 6-phosphogluconolactonase [Rhodanobacteraceae bacterium]|nr:6-phosphogluconolactonase [Rhodanobacteraceae bacterium]
MTGQILRWHEVNDAAAMCREAVERILAAAAEAIADRDSFSIVLSGGETPRATYRAMRSVETDWSLWQVWYGDERCVPPGDRERNSLMAREEWLDHVAIPAANIHPMPAEQGPDEGARLYAEMLRDVGPFDLNLLGLGRNGHTASLMPGDDWGEGEDAPATLGVTGSPKPPPERVSLSARRLSDSRHVLFLVDGPAKREALERWRAGERIPAAAVTPAAGVDVIVSRE